MEPASAKTSPIPAELWQRLRRLDPHCIIHISRRSPDFYHLRQPRHPQHPPAPPIKRVWAFLIYPEGAMAADNVRIEHPRFIEALRLALEECEARGWARLD